MSQSGRVKKLWPVFPCLLVSKMLHVPQVAHLDYPTCQHLRTVSKDELLSHFCETPSIWGERQNTPCSGFAKGPRFLNMVITFVLTPLSHYNSITKSRAWFLLSLLEDISIDFPFHFIISIIDVYRDTTRLSHRSFAIFLSLFLILLSILSWVPSTQCLFGGTRPSFDQSGRRPRWWILQPLQPLPFLPPPIILLRRVVWLLRQSWHSFNAWMLALILSLLSCIKWIPMLVVLHDDRLALVASLLLHFQGRLDAFRGLRRKLNILF